MSDFEKLKNSFKQKILEAKDSKEIANISSKVFGKKGFINLKKINPGDYIVHKIHGIGQFLKLEKINITG